MAPKKSSASNQSTSQKSSSTGPITQSSKPSTSSTAAVAATTPTYAAATSPPPPTASSKQPLPALSPKSSPQEIGLHVWKQYLNNTPSRTLLLDSFMLFLVLVGVVQFLYAVVGGNFPFNAFLSGFSAAVGQFVLTASLRMQTTERSPNASSTATASTANKKSVKIVDPVTGEVGDDTAAGKISSERAFADFVFGSLILHGFCVNFIN